MKRIRQELQRLLRDEQGLSAIEYGILASLIALAALQALGSLGGENAKSYDTSADKLAEQRDRSAPGGSNPDDTSDQGNPDEPAFAADAPVDSGADTSSPDEPPVAASKALP